jgi:peptidoglycan hydrolase-like protein with peptidoglycan-binding domain
MRARQALARAWAGSGSLTPRASVSAARTRRLVLTILLAIGAAGTGWVAGRGIESPEAAARNAKAPQASPITAPVERRVIETSVVVRGDVAFAAQFDLLVDSDIGDGSLGQLVLTGRLPKSGSRLAEGDVALEVSGRPVFVLVGALPMYRGLRPGSTGEDVHQIEEALRRLGFFTAIPDTRYDQATAAAVGKMYAAAGYQPVGPSTQEPARLAAAQQVSAASTIRDDAQRALNDARKGPPRSAVLAARAEVDQAQAAVEHAQRGYDQAIAAGAPADQIADLKAALDAAEDHLAVAKAQFDELTAPPDTAALQRRLDEADEALADAESTLAHLSATLGNRVPRGEVVFVPSLPRRVDTVTAKVGDTPQGPVLHLTATALQVDISLTAQERSLRKVGDDARLDDATSGVNLTGTVAFIADTPGSNGALPGSYYARIEPRGGDPQRLNGVNLRVTVPVKSTGGPVLAVPVAALVTGADGTVTVRVDGDRGAARDRSVRVAVGLSADGYAQVTPVDAGLAEGELVVVGDQW